MKVKLITVDDTKSDQIQRVIDLLKSEKQAAASNGNEDEANKCWRELEALELNTLYIQAFNNLKSKCYRQAWIELEQCEINYLYISKNSTQEFLDTSRLNFIQDKVLKLQSLYPYCLFCSPEYKVGYCSCSICGHKVRPRSRCEHKKGKVYNGELCLHKVHEIEILGISFVTKPVQKYSVMHDDSTLDFTLIERLVSNLDDAFEDWNINWTKMKFPIERFSRVSKDDPCPCKSGDIFGACCMCKNEVEIPHLDFFFSKPLPSDAETIRFPY
ncbi:hypothetical protein [Shewanella xiamenensis]|uniref:hypothetical protein n=1 Tax=Shewanella xiamenensis TaxID=332186 RepID=UPI002E7BFC41|nr:hypothetical protein [Shewanella xiamenensis]MEE1982753.1 hypothetical protein [Shewanella xiamenensis]